MRTRVRTALAVLVFVVAGLAAAGRAEANPFMQAVTWGRPQASAGLRFGSDSLNLGIGGRGGFTLVQGVYVGGLFDYFFGEGGAHLFDLGAEAGFDFAITPEMMVRPFAGLGIAAVRACVGDFCESDSDTFIELGGIFNYFLPQFFVGGELRILAFQDTAVVLGGHVGLLF
jgi:hypothetical protein